jgi:hypothetical protein
MRHRPGHRFRRALRRKLDPASSGYLRGPAAGTLDGGIVVPTVLAGTTILMMTPSPMRAQIMAVHLLLMNMLALSLEPFIVAVVTDKVFGRPAAVGYSLACVDVAASRLIRA